MTEQKKPRGFALMSEDMRKAIASIGGASAWALGKAHRFTKEEAGPAGRLGGLKRATVPGLMSELGKRGGLACAAKPGHMAKMAAASAAARRERHPHIVRSGNDAKKESA